MPAVWAVGFVPVLAVELAAFAGVFVFCLGLAVGLGGALCVLAEAEPAGAVACAPADRAAGSAIISNESRTTIQPEAGRATGIGEEMALISLL